MPHVCFALTVPFICLSNSSAYSNPLSLCSEGSDFMADLIQPYRISPCRRFTSRYASSPDQRLELFQCIDTVSLPGIWALCPHGFCRPLTASFGADIHFLYTVKHAAVNALWNALSSSGWKIVLTWENIFKSSNVSEIQWRDKGEIWEQMLLSLLSHPTWHTPTSSTWRILHQSPRSSHFFSWFIRNCFFLIY